MLTAKQSRLLLVVWLQHEAWLPCSGQCKCETLAAVPLAPQRNVQVIDSARISAADTMLETSIGGLGPTGSHPLHASSFCTPSDAEFGAYSTLVDTTNLSEGIYRAGQ